MLLATPRQMQLLEQLTDRAGVSYAEMMEHAGYGLAAFIRDFVPDGQRAVFLAGTGNNGGDCYVAAYHLALAGWEVQVIAPFGAPKTEISRNAAERAAQLAHVPMVSAPDDFRTRADVIVDGLFGTGFRGELPEGTDCLLAVPEGARCIACDIPSGGNGVTGSVSRFTARADATVTFGAVKLGMTQYPLREYCGEIHTVSIGTPAEVWESFAEQAVPARLAAWKDVRLPVNAPDTHKNRRGHLLTVAGSIRMRGACVLASEAAMRSGAGLETTASAEAALQTLAVRVPECMCLPLLTDAEGFFLDAENRALLRHALAGKNALLIGCGMGVTEHTRNLTKFLFAESTCPDILDGDGLNAVSDCIECIPEGRTILTPHPAEAARLLGMTAAQVQADRPAAARLLAEKTGAVAVLKGAGTIVTDGTRMTVCTDGNAGMARAGSGDVLAGIIASLAAQGMPLYEAAWCGVLLHARAGDTAARRLPERYMLPQDLIKALGEVMQDT